jgi:hypothetical protein
MWLGARAQRRPWPPGRPPSSWEVRCPRGLPWGHRLWQHVQRCVRPVPPAAPTRVRAPQCCAARVPPLRLPTDAPPLALQCMPVAELAGRGPAPAARVTARARERAVTRALLPARRHRAAAGDHRVAAAAGAARGRARAGQWCAPAPRGPPRGPPAASAGSGRSQMRRAHAQDHRSRGCASAVRPPNGGAEAGGCARSAGVSHEPQDLAVMQEEAQALAAAAPEGGPAAAAPAAPADPLPGGAAAPGAGHAAAEPPPPGAGHGAAEPPPPAEAARAGGGHAPAMAEPPGPVGGQAAAGAAVGAGTGVGAAVGAGAGVEAAVGAGAGVGARAEGEPLAQAAPVPMY